YWTATPRSVLAAGMETFADSDNNPFGGVTNVEDLPFGTPDELISARIDANEYADRKTAACRAHATQIPSTSWLWTIAANFGEEFMGVEHYQLVAGHTGPGEGRYGWE